MSVSSAVESKFSILDIAEQHEAIKKDFFDAFEKLYDSNFSSDESAESEFEIEFAKFCQTRYAVGVNNGTSALHLALLTLNVGAGDEVILPANTHIGAAWAVSYTGATPIFVDCTDDTWQISIHMSEKITSRTKVIIGVHMYGQPCDIRGIKEICRKNKLFFLEDASHANGAKYKNIPVGSFGEMGCFNCCPGHNLGGCGEAGVITTNNKQYYKRLKSLRNNGSVLKYYHDEIGFNMRINVIEATFLNIKLKYLEEWNQRRKEIAKRYRSRIIVIKLKIQLL